MLWTDDILTGHPQIDAQHRRIYDEVTSLRFSPVESIGSFLEYFPDHAASHFGLEEHLMREYRFPLLYDHERAHTDFFDRFVHLRAAYLKDRSREALDRLVDAITHWLVDHVLGHDRQLARWVRENNGR